MKTSNRASKQHAGKKAAAVQSETRPKNASGNPQSEPAEKRVGKSPDIATYLDQAVQIVLGANTSNYGLSVETIADYLPRFGFIMDPDQVQPVLKKLEQAGKVVNKDATWR